MKTKSILGLFILAILVLPLINADVIVPGRKTIPVENILININDFPDYVFVSYGVIGPSMCPIKIINLDGKIGGYYKHCTPSVYAIPKDKFNSAKIEEINKNDSLRGDEVTTYLFSIGAIEVIRDIEIYETVSEASFLKEMSNYYSINLEQTKTQPDKIINVKDNTKLLVYISLSLISLIIIAIILIKRGWRK